MNKKSTILAVIAMTFLFGLPLDGFGYSTTNRETTFNSGSGTQVVLRVGQPRRRRARRGGYWRNGRYYRNYGQFRRTQVGNRRYRMVRRYYWDDGRRYTRWVRVYY